MFHPTLHKSTRFLFWPILKSVELLGIFYPKALLSLRYRHTFGHKLDWNNPKDINEKICWAKVYSDTKEWVDLADKRKVRDYVAKKGLSDTLVNLYATWYSEDDVDIKKLPDHFIIKANNGDGKGTNKIIDKRLVLESEIKSLVRNWLNRKNIGAMAAEPHYRNMKPCVIAEELLPIRDGNTLTDYKIWCFNGKAYYILVCNDRSKGGNSAHLLTYDLGWNAHPEFSVFTSDYPQGEVIPKPKNFTRMIEIAEILSQGFPEVRVDLYNIDGKIYFGELTFTSLGGLMDYYTKDFLLELGSKFDISQFPVKK